MIYKSFVQQFKQKNNKTLLENISAVALSNTARESANLEFGNKR